MNIAQLLPPPRTAPTRRVAAAPAHAVAVPQFDIGRAMRRLRMRHFELLAALDTEGTMRGAARRMVLTQSAVSKMLREAEESFGAVLFTRNRAGMSPTPIGHVVIARAITLVNDLMAAGEDVTLMSLGLGASLRIGVATPVPRVSVALARLRAERAGVVLRLRTAAASLLVDALLNAELDCVIGSLPHSATGTEATEQLRCVTIADDEVCIVCSVHHPLADASGLRWQDLATAQWVLPPHGTLVRQAIADTYRALGCLPPQSTVEASAPVLALDMLTLDRTLIGAVRREQVAPALASGHIRRLRMVPEVSLPPLSLITRRQRCPTDGIVTLLHTALLAAAPPLQEPDPDPARTQPRQRGRMADRLDFLARLYRAGETLPDAHPS